MKTSEIQKKLESSIFRYFSKHWPCAYYHTTEPSQTHIAVYVYMPADRQKKPESAVTFGALVSWIKKSLEQDGFPSMKHEQIGKIESEELHYFIFWLPLVVDDQSPSYSI